VPAGLGRAPAPEKAGPCPERDDAHSRGDLGAVNGVAVDAEVVAGGAGGHGDRHR